MQMIGSLVSTKFDRMMAILNKRFPWREAKAFREQAFSAAAVSVITQSSWVIDRFLGISRNPKKRKISQRIISGSVRRLDDIQRFVYSQVWKQAYWLSTRSERPRDKSKGSRDSLQEDLRWFLDPTVACPCERADCLYGSIPNPGEIFKGNRSGGYQSDTQELDSW
jgi:hypothetical protein